MSTRNFLTLLNLSPDELGGLIKRAIELKASHAAGKHDETCKHRVLAMVFEKSSTRTRMSFEVGMAQLGGHAIFLSPRFSVIINVTAERVVRLLPPLIITEKQVDMIIEQVSDLVRDLLEG